MRVTSRRTTPVLALAVAVLAVAPMAAVAAPVGDETEPEVAISPANDPDDADDPDAAQPEDVDLDADSDDPADDTDGDDPQPDADSDDPADDTTEPQLSCPDLLLQVRPGTAPIGDERAVAITSQSVDADVPGWLFVSWEAADGTELTGVIVERSNGATTLIPGTTEAEVSDDLRTGGVPDALSLTFCGTALAAPTSPDEDDETGTDDETDSTPDDGDATTGSTSGSSTTPGPSGTTGSGSAGASSPSGSADPSDDDSSEVATSSVAPTDDEAAAPDVSSTEPADDDRAPDVSATPEQDPTADVEVLGVQFTNETTGLPAWASWLGVLAGLAASGAAAIVLLRMRAREVAG